MPLKTSIKFGAALVRNNREKAGYYIAKSIGCKEETARNFGLVYSIALERFGVSDATKVFGPAYLKVAQTFFGEIRKADFDKKRSEVAAAFVDQGLSLIMRDRRYIQLFGGMVDDALNIIKDKITRKSDESWLYALGCAELKLNGEDVPRFSGNVYDFVNRNFSVRNALLLSAELERYDRTYGAYKKDITLAYLSSQLEQGIKEDQAVRYTIGKLRTDIMRGTIVLADGTKGRIEDGKIVTGNIKS